ncbi:MAG TPA: hypothetical protein VMX97_03380 [Hyphomicrobiaceae bacterium]|nr:hypothetical protein [Hyphomicrobiaceae bacterium]
MANAFQSDAFQIQVIGGLNGDSHKITVKVLTSAGEKIEEDVNLFVVEK